MSHMLITVATLATRPGALDSRRCIPSKLQEVSMRSAVAWLEDIVNDMTIVLESHAMIIVEYMRRTHMRS